MQTHAETHKNTHPETRSPYNNRTTTTTSHPDTHSATGTPGFTWVPMGPGAPGLPRPLPLPPQLQLQGGLVEEGVHEAQVQTRHTAAVQNQDLIPRSQPW